ncbi:MULTISPECIES: sulfatase-like hydrolase/transferase [Haloferacaceae]|uniref:Sulfatase-like hydrolase/transferase n=1 Tax=Halorubrum glutamatedens TaxID=2707018 RepID=A0ABD5QSF3_9EURY|nr:sulfatase-like hydrolase/transferase [Halobellus captivus]
MALPNVLLVVLDSVRARNVGLYGYHRETTPFLSTYSDRATVYRQARSPGIHSVASHASLWTGAEVVEHQATRHTDGIQPEKTIWGELAENGYRTGIFTVNSVVAHASNLVEPFHLVETDDFSDSAGKPFPDAHGPTDVAAHEGVAGNLARSLQDDAPVRSFLNAVDHLYRKQRGRLETNLDSETLIERFLEWEADVDGPWAACLNLMDSHFPYEPAEEHDKWSDDTLGSLHDGFEKPPANEFVQGRPWWQLEAFKSLYDGTIRELDAHLERIVTGLKRADVHDETLVVITSDHGEGFGEISRLTGRTRLVDHSWGIHEVVTHVPLVVKYPRQTDPTTIKEPATITGFPDSVRATLEGSCPRDSFVPDGPVIAYTERLLADHADVFDDSDEPVTAYYGPWRAVYESSDNGDVVKYAGHGNNALTLRVRNAQDAILVDRTGSEMIDRVFDTFEPVDIRQEPGDISEKTEERLSDLGYIR